MAKQDNNPPPWKDSMSDGGTMIMDKLPISGDATPDFVQHDKAYHYGGGFWEKTKSDFALSKNLFKRGPGWKILSPVVFIGVTIGGLFNWNWKGLGIDNKLT